MVNYYIYATDDSRSTYGNNYFNMQGLETLKKFNEEVPEIQCRVIEQNMQDQDERTVYLHWSDRCVSVGEDEVRARYEEKNGAGKYTLPHTVLDWITENLTERDIIRLLYVITDGAVHPTAIKACTHNIQIDYVNFYAFNSNVNKIDMSVASMFMCNNVRYIVYCNDTLVDEADLSKPFDYKQITSRNFKKKKEDLKSYIKLQFLTKTSTDVMALDEIKKLKHLQKRLQVELEANLKLRREQINLNVKDKDTFLERFKKTTFYATLHNSDYYVEKQNIATFIGTLINYINSDKKSFDFDNLKFDKKFTAITEAEPLNGSYTIERVIPFPDIILSNEVGVPVILLTRHTLIRKILYKHGTQFSRFRSILDCPLFLLLDNLLKDSIEYYYNFEAFKGMVEHGIKVGPRTRERFVGAIVPLEQFDEYNDYIISCTYFERRKVSYNKGLFYYVLYKTCESLQYMEPNVVEYLKQYVIKRIAKTTCYLGLSTTSVDDPLIRVDLITALWYCVELSSILFKDDPKHFKKEKMRQYSIYTGYMMEILQWFEYSIDRNLVDLRSDIFRHVNCLKRIPPRLDAKYILEQIFEKKEDFLIANIVHPDNIYKLNYLMMDHRQVIDENILNAEVDLREFAHFMNHVETTDVPVCKQTMRPYFVTQDKTTFYDQLMKQSQRVVSENETIRLEPVDRLDFTRILSTSKLYIAYVKQFLQFPKIYQFKDYVLEKKRYFGDKPVIFATNTLEIIENTFARYDNIVNDADDPIDVAKFIEIVNSTANRKNRIKTEKPVDFDLNQITSLITTSEKKSKIYNDTKWCVLL